MIFDKLFTLMAEKQASDIYITAGAPIQIKIQGHTMPINQQVMDPPMIRRMLSELISPELAERFDREKELNISRGVTNLGNFRINAFWQRNSVSIVMRFIQSEIPTMESLGLPTVLSDVVMEKRGLVLVVGSTGSGKSTTLASMIDRETMQAALAYAQTGHLCLATLHANNAYHALNRIVNFFPLENRSLLYLDLAVSLRSILSQRLVRQPNGKRIPAVEILMNTRHMADLIERGELNGIKEAMEQSLAPGSQTFEQDLFHLYKEKVISLDEALANADSPTNLSWLINNAQASKETKAAPPKPTPGSSDFERTDPEGTSFREFSLHLDDSAND